MESYCSLCTFKVPQGANNLIICTLDTIHRLFFVTRLIINQINKWVDFKLENVLVSLHSLKTMDLGPFGASAPLFLRNGEIRGHSPILNNHSGSLSKELQKQFSNWGSLLHTDLLIVKIFTGMQVIIVL